MRRPLAMALLCVTATSLAAACDDGTTDDTFIDRQAGAKDNGGTCLFTGAGAGVCAGQTCLRLGGTDTRGVCSESCDEDCRFEGVCTLVPDLYYNNLPAGDVRLCLQACEALADCADAVSLGCVPLGNAKICDGSGCASSGDQAFCVPLPRTPPAGADAGP